MALNERFVTEVRLRSALNILSKVYHKKVLCLEKPQNAEK